MAIALCEGVLNGDRHGAVGLEMEITKSLIMQDLAANIPKLKALRDRSVSISIDGFGSGYSSLSCLAKLPGNVLKIDKSFIRDRETSDEVVTIVKTIIFLAHSLGLKVIAEGGGDRSAKDLAARSTPAVVATSGARVACSASGLSHQLRHQHRRDNVAPLGAENIVGTASRGRVHHFQADARGQQIF